MNLRLVFVLFLVGACGKTSDLPAMQDEANGIVVMYKPRFDHLGKRMGLLEDRSKRLPPQQAIDPASLKEVQKLFGDANAKLASIKQLMSDAPEQIRDAARDDANKNPRIELLSLMAEMREHLDAEHAEINASLDTVESWLANLERRPQVAIAPPPPKPEPTPVPEPAPAPAPEPVRGGSADPH